VSGDVLVALTSDRVSRLDPGSVLTTGRGDLTVVSSSRHHDRWIVHFEGLTDRDQADTWRGTLLSAEPVDDDDDDTLWVHELIGEVVALSDGTEVGTVAAVEPNPASDLLVLDGGALVPLVFVTSREAGRITIDPPEGLFDL
jgi:16S rRNA processing protein RimM